MHKIDSTNAYNPTSTGLITGINFIPQGDDEGQRQGNSVLLRKVANQISIEKAVSVPSTLVKVMLILDLQQSPDVSPNVSDVIEPSQVATTFAPMARLNKTTVGRFTILSSRLVYLNTFKTSAVINLNKIMRHHVRFNGPASTDIQKGGIYLMTISDQANAIDAPLCRRTTRIQYHDN